MNILKSKVVLILLAIILLGSAVRFYNLTTTPPALYWDEVSVGYNAWSVSHYGKDEWSNVVPVTFKAFGDVKKPVDVYITAVSQLIFGLNSFGTRFPSAFFGVLNILLIYFLGKRLFKSRLIGILAAFFLALSPYNIHFSRFNHEANIALFFLGLGILLFYKGLENRKYLLLLSIISFIISALTYNAALIISPIIFFLLVALNIKKVFHLKFFLLVLLIPIIIFIIISFKNPDIFGGARINQTGFSDDDIKQTQFYKNTNNVFIARFELYATQYTYYFYPKYLFFSGDNNPRLSLKVIGEFYLLDLPLLLIGVFFLIKKRSKEGLLILLWALIAPIPGVLVKEAPHAGRGLFMMLSWQIIEGFGLYSLYRLIPKQKLRQVVLVSFLAIYLGFSLFYLNKYINEYSALYPHDWQYGIKEAIDYTKDQKNIREIFMTTERSQPYIFFLYYLAIPQPIFHQTVSYNYSENRSSSLVYSFDKYVFDKPDLYHTIADKEVLYILTPSEYDGLANKMLFDQKKVIYYPKGDVAFFVIQAK